MVVRRASAGIAQEAVCVLETAEPEEGQASIVVRPGAARIGRDRRIEGRQRFVVTLEVPEHVAALDHPPGNVAVSAGGRVFLTLHPEGSPHVRFDVPHWMPLIGEAVTQW